MPKLTKEQVIKTLDKMNKDNSQKNAHIIADELLLEFLISEGYEDIVKAYKGARERVYFYYA